MGVGGEGVEVCIGFSGNMKQCMSCKLELKSRWVFTYWERGLGERSWTQKERCAPLGAFLGLLDGHGSSRLRSLLLAVPSTLDHEWNATCQEHWWGC